MILIKNARVMDPESGFDQVTDILLDGNRIRQIGKVDSNIPSYLTSGDDRRHSTYETLEYFKNAGLTKFRVYKKKRLLLISAKKPLE